MIGTDVLAERAPVLQKICRFTRHFALKFPCVATVQRAIAILPFFQQGNPSIRFAPPAVRSRATTRPPATRIRHRHLAELRHAHAAHPRLHHAAPGAVFPMHIARQYLHCSRHSAMKSAIPTGRLPGAGLLAGHAYLGVVNSS
jgi:hypothetical protein